MSADNAHYDYKRLWSDMLDIQRKNRMLALLSGVGEEGAGPSVSYTEGLVLHIIEVKPDSSVKEVTEVLGLEQSWVSRIITDLESRELIRSIASETDRRSKLLTISSKGRKKLKELNAFRRALVEKDLMVLSEKQQKNFSKYLRMMNDNMKVPGFESEGSHPVDSELVRMSWGLGVIGNSFMGSDLNVSQYQLFFSLSKREEGVSVSDLYEELPLDMSSISRAVAAFGRKGLVAKVRSRLDKRSFSVELTAEGRKVWSGYQKEALDRMKYMTRTFSEKEFSEFIDLFDAITAETITRGRGSNREKLSIKPLKRAAFLQEVAQLGVEAGEIEKLSGKRGVKFLGGYSNSQIKGVFCSLESGEDELSSVFLVGKELTRKDCIKLLQKGCEPECTELV